MDATACDLIFAIGKNTGVLRGVRNHLMETMAWSGSPTHAIDEIGVVYNQSDVAV